MHTRADKYCVVDIRYTWASHRFTILCYILLCLFIHLFFLCINMNCMFFFLIIKKKYGYIYILLCWVDGVQIHTHIRTHVHTHISMYIFIVYKWNVKKWMTYFFLFFFLLFFLSFLLSSKYYDFTHKYIITILM